MAILKTLHYESVKRGEALSEQEQNMRLDGIFTAEIQQFPMLPIGFLIESKG